MEKGFVLWICTVQTQFYFIYLYVVYLTMLSVAQTT
jgi:hypothetical protein